MVIPEKLRSVRWAWMDGELVPFEDAKVHVFSPGFRYGLGVLEGLRAYWSQSQKQLYVVKVTEHFKRLSESAKIMRLNIGYGPDETAAILRKLIQANEFREDLHIRHYVYLAGYGGFDSTEPVGSFVVCYPRGRIYDPAQGIRCCVSSWQRIADNAFPPRVKLGANYNNSRLAKVEANMHGYDDAILLNQAGKVTETSAAALLMIRSGQLVIPPRTSGVLESITGEAIIELLHRERGLPAIERDVDRTELYIAEELFICGSGAEVAPVVSVDGLPVSGGTPGPMTRWVQQRYFSIVRGEVPEYMNWLTPIYGARQPVRTAGIASQFERDP